MRLNKKGDERVLSLYWFIMFAIITIGVVSGVIIFYGHPLDIREKEVGLMNDKLIDCFVDNGVLNAKKMGNSIDVVKNCGLYLDDSSIKEYIGNSQYFFRVRISGEKDYEASYGNSDFEVYCSQKESKINIPFCAKKKLYVLNEKGEFVLMEVTGAIRKTEQNAV